jgi:hypothetical protein
MILGSGYMNRADRFTYLAQIGLLIMIVWGASELLQRRKVPKRAIAAMAGVVLVALAVPAWKQVSYWSDSATLFRRSLSVSEHKVAHTNLGDVLMSERKPEEALRIFRPRCGLIPDLRSAPAGWLPRSPVTSDFPRLSRRSTRQSG